VLAATVIRRFRERAPRFSVPRSGREPIAGQCRKFCCHSSEYIVRAASVRVFADGIYRLARLVRSSSA
jgi:hypothetical protein